ncbi:DUF502 domain-containing protein [Acidiferrobacter sp.]|uniref:DUF502 domain-containing protein n=1 Tax=Acidiferrobacter sp. TaxID=1872107 RepID=UPI0026075C99|nr:DUF502 domain-containing protein [Acidiferrobacter sp.]
MGRFRRYLTAGLLVWVPLGVTFLAVESLVDFANYVLGVLPPDMQPEHWLGHDIPGLGVLLVFIGVLATGVVVANVMGQWLLALGESLLARIPLVRSVYSSVKQLLESLMSGSGNSFRTVVLVPYPHPGSWTLAFLTGDGLAEASAALGTELVSVFVPATPNPTSGFFLMVPKKDVVELSMSVDEGLRMILSMGMVAPGLPRKGAAPASKRVAG